MQPGTLPLSLFVILLVFSNSCAQSGPAGSGAAGRNLQSAPPRSASGSGVIAEKQQPRAAPPLSSEEAETARKLYTLKCAKCHEFYNPNAYTQTEWDTWMKKMRRKSKLKPDQFDLLSRYLDNVRAEKQAGAR